MLAATRAIGGEIPTILEAGTDEATALALELSDVTGEMEALIAQVISGEKPADLLEGEMTELARRAKEALEEANRIDGLDLDHAIGAVDGLSTALATALGWASSLVDKIGEIAGVPAAGGDAGLSRNPFDVGGEPMTSSPRPQRPGVDSLGNWQDANTPKTKGGGGGRGKGNNRLDALVASLQTEREILTEWYQESLDLLNNATEAQLAALGGKHEAIERLEREHKERLAEIDQMTNATRLDEMGNFFGAMASLTAAGGEKLVKATRVFGAAEALVNTFRAQSQVLADPRLGFFGKMAAYASIGAAGMGLVAALRGGGSGSSASAKPSTASTAAASTEDARPVNISIQGINPNAWYTGQQFINTVDAIQQEFKRRGIRLTII